MWGWLRFDRMSFLQLSVCVRARFCFCFFLRLYARVLVHDLQYTKDQFLIAVYFHLAFLFLVCQRSIPLMKSATRKPRFDKVRSRSSDDPHLRLVGIFFSHILTPPVAAFLPARHIFSAQSAVVFIPRRGRSLFSHVNCGDIGTRRSADLVMSLTSPEPDDLWHLGSRVTSPPLPTLSLCSLILCLSGALFPSLWSFIRPKKGLVCGIECSGRRGRGKKTNQQKHSRASPCKEDAVSLSADGKRLRIDWQRFFLTL